MIIAIGGATATGKSALAVEIAQRFDCEIVSADSMQIYKGMDIGTAKITEEEKGGITHHLIDIIGPKDSYNVAMYVTDAEKAIECIQKKGKTPIVVGGTGLYIRSLLYNYSMGAHDDELRLELHKELEEKGTEYMWQKLEKLDPIAAKKIHMNNVKRVIRALEVKILTGRSITEEQNTEQKEHILTCISADRTVLYDRINKRVEKMFERGLEKEIRDLLASGVTFYDQSMQAIGYKEFKEYIEGTQTIEEVEERIKLNSRHYAKRQETWFRAMTAEWYNLEDKDKIFNKMEQIIIK